MAFERVAHVAVPHILVFGVCELLAFFVTIDVVTAEARKLLYPCYGRFAPGGERSIGVRALAPRSDEGERGGTLPVRIERQDRQDEGGQYGGADNAPPDEPLPLHDAALLSTDPLPPFLPTPFFALLYNWANSSSYSAPCSASNSFRVRRPVRKIQDIGNTASLR